MENYGLNRVTLIGKVVQQPRLRYSPQGFPIAQMVLSVPDPVAPEPNRMQQVVVGLTKEEAEQAAQLLRGTLVMVEGGLHHAKPHPPEQLQLHGHTLQVLSRPRAQSEQPPTARFAQYESPAPGYTPDDELPF